MYIILAHKNLFESQFNAHIHTVLCIIISHHPRGGGMVVFGMVYSTKPSVSLS